MDGMLKDLQDISYLLSPQDLMAVSHVPELIASGVGCFKIEGRLKGPEYVALTTQASAVCSQPDAAQQARQLPGLQG